MTRSFILPQARQTDLKDLPPSSPQQIRAMAQAAGLSLPEPLMEELCNAFPPFEAMVRRLPRARDRFDEPAHTIDVARVAALEDDSESTERGKS